LQAITVTINEEKLICEKNKFYKFFLKNKNKQKNKFYKFFLKNKNKQKNKFYKFF
jgi:hypothetical protein